jgi:putative ABC transport system ATP-binding protein
MISLQAVTKTYGSPAGERPVIQDIDLEIRGGELVGITGKSGSGKSTLLNLMGGIDRPSSGTIRVGGEAIGGMTENQLSTWRGRTVGIVFQFFQLLPTLTAAENVMLPMDFRRTLPARERRQRAVDLLERVGVRPQADKLPSTLSGGEQQRVAIARALANDPPLILADEPTGNLDSATGASIGRLLAELKAQGTTVVVVTHDRESLRSADRIMTLTDGRIVDSR